MDMCKARELAAEHVCALDRPRHFRFRRVQTEVRGYFRPVVGRSCRDRAKTRRLC